MRRPRLAQPLLIVALAVGILAGVVLQQRALADPGRAAAPRAVQAVSMVTQADGVPSIRRPDTAVRVHGTIATRSAPALLLGAPADRGTCCSSRGQGGSDGSTR
jgi:hypothetical protein